MKRRTKNILTVICCVLAVTALLTLIGRWTGGSFNVIDQLRGNRNPNNLLTVETYTVEKNKDGDMEGTTGYGVSFKVKDDGRITLSGTNKGYEDKVQYVPFASLNLKPGTYTLSGYEKAQLNTLGVYALVNGNKIFGDGLGEEIVIDQESTVVIGFYIYNDVNTFGKTLYPVLVSGTTAGEFYTK